MAAPRYDTTLDRGITFTRVIALKSGGNAFDLTGCTLASQLRTSPNSPQLAGTFTCALDNDPTTGQFTMEMSKTDTGKLEAGQYSFDIVLTLGGGKNKKIAQGTITATNSCTR